MREHLSVTLTRCMDEDLQRQAWKARKTWTEINLPNPGRFPPSLLADFRVADTASRVSTSLVLDCLPSTMFL